MELTTPQRHGLPDAVAAHPGMKQRRAQVREYDGEERHGENGVSLAQEGEQWPVDGRDGRKYKCTEELDRISAGRQHGPADGR